jgi:hypothetical protein
MSRTTDDAYYCGTRSWFEYDHESPYYIPAYGGPPPPSDTHVQYDLGAYETTPYGNGNGDANFGNGRLDERLVDYGPNAHYEDESYLPQHDDMLVRRAAECGLTPEELLEVNEDCIRVQTEWMAGETKRGDNEGEGSRGDQRVMRAGDERGEYVGIEETEPEEFGGHSGYEGTPHMPHLGPEPGTYDVNDASNASPTSNVREYQLDDASFAPPPSNERDDEVNRHEFVSTAHPQERYAADLIRRAAELGMTPGELHELNEECIREQLADAETRGERDDELRSGRRRDEGDATETERTERGEFGGYPEHGRHGTHPPNDVREVLEAYGMATPPPNREAANPEHDDGTGVHAPVHTVYTAVEYQVDNAVPFENDGATPWHEMQAADGYGANTYGAWPNPQEERDLGGYLPMNHPPPPPPTFWQAPQPPNLRFGHPNAHFRPKRPRP